METADDDDDLKLVKASASLLSDLESALPKLLWKTSKTTKGRNQIHTQVRRRDLDYVVKLIDPFQSEPQLLDAKLKNILPPIVDAYIEYLRLGPTGRSQQHVDFQSAICVILYTLCKVRGYKVIVGFLNNEPKYLEPILNQLEGVLSTDEENEAKWQVPYVLLLWLSHLLLTPFDLSSISDDARPEVTIDGLTQLPTALPFIARRVLLVGLKYLPVPTKAQDAAAMLLFRLVVRPDMQKLRLADVIVERYLQSLQDLTPEIPTTIYERIGPLRFLAGIATSAEVGHMIPSLYRTCEKFSQDETSIVSSNAVAKKITVKIIRNIAVVSLRSASTQGPLSKFLESTSVLEDIIDYLLRSLSDRDTPVRYAAAKALSLIILELDPSMGHEIVQAMLDMFQEDMPRYGETMDFSAANALKWHGLTLALAHTLFKRSASPDQLPNIVTALVSALQFEQRIATGSSIGTNVRDAANFGIWSLSRRYTTKELLSVPISDIKSILPGSDQHSVIHVLAIQLILSACLDPAGNIRRGSSAALQELIGRHPDQVHEGIALVQIVDYQAVGLRRRAMVDVSNRAAELHSSYWTALFDSLVGWRGLGSPDVPSREAAAASLAKLNLSSIRSENVVLLRTVQGVLDRCHPTDAEDLHGLVLSISYLIEPPDTAIGNYRRQQEQEKPLKALDFSAILDVLSAATKDFSQRLLRADLPFAVAKFLAALCRSLSADASNTVPPSDSILTKIDLLTERLLARHEQSLQQAIPSLVQSLLTFKRKTVAALGCISTQNLCKKVAIDSSKSTLNGAGRAIALGALSALYGDGLVGDKALNAVSTLAALTSAMNVDWRIIGVRSLQLGIESIGVNEAVDPSIAEIMAKAVHSALVDYTIDERGDIGSLVRMQGISCASSIFARHVLSTEIELRQLVEADILRLSLEKLDRVRFAAAECRRTHLRFGSPATDIATVSSPQYLRESLQPLIADEPAWTHTALWEGCISCAGVSAEPLLQNARSALVHLLSTISLAHLQNLISILATILKSYLLESGNMHPALEFLAFLLDMHIPQRIAETDFKWRNLLSTVQKSHHKSNDIPKILAAVHVYRGIADIAVIRTEVLKKLISMLRTNPYPRVRSSVAETLFVLTNEHGLKGEDWTKPASHNLKVIEQLEERYLKS